MGDRALANATDPRGGPDQSPGRPAGLAVVAAATLAAATMLVGPAQADYCCTGDLFDPWTWLLVGALLVLGVVMLVASPRVASLAAAAGGVAAAQLAGTGVIATRRWNPLIGMYGGGSPPPGLMRTIGVVVAAAGVCAVVACLVALVRAAALPYPVGMLPRLVAVVAGGAVLLAVPYLSAGGQSDLLDATSLGAHALLLSGPLGVSLALTGWVRTTESTAVCAAVSLSAAAVLPQRNLVHTGGRTATFGFVVAATVVVLVVRLATGRRGRGPHPSA